MPVITNSKVRKTKIHSFLLIHFISKTLAVKICLIYSRKGKTYSILI